MADLAQDPISKHVHVSERTKILVVNLEDTEVRNDCAGEGQLQSNRQTVSPTHFLPNGEPKRKMVKSKDDPLGDISPGNLSGLLFHALVQVQVTFLLNKRIGIVTKVRT
jgi:hypothetical protein